MSAVPEDVLAVLSELEFPQADRACFPAHLGKLDRALYVRVDKILRAIGGVWTARHQAHVFSGPGVDARARVDGVVTSGEVTTDRDLGNFATPVLLAHELVVLAGAGPEHDALEPSAGSGRLVSAMLAAGVRTVAAVERDPARRRALVQLSRERAGTRLVVAAASDDFLTIDWAGQAFDRVVMNPPFCRSGRGDHLDHVRRAHDLLRPGGMLVAVLPASVTFRIDRRHQAFRDWLTQHAGAGSDDGIVRDLPAGTFRESGTEVRAVVVRLQKRG